MWVSRIRFIVDPLAGGSHLLHQTNEGAPHLGSFEMWVSASHSYTYDADGKILQVDGGTTASYVYDALDQRVRVTAGSSDLEYVFDPFGRRQSSWVVGSNAGNAGRVY